MKTVQVSERKLKLLERDAKRYRFLRKAVESEKFDIGVWLTNDGLPIKCGWLDSQELDQEIDEMQRANG